MRTFRPAVTLYFNCPRFRCNTPISVHDLSTTKRPFVEIPRFKYSATAGVGHDNPNKDPLVGGFRLSAQDRKDLIEFLMSLTDDKVLHDSRFTNPW